MKLNLLKESISTFYREGFDAARERWKWLYQQQEKCGKLWLTDKSTILDDIEMALQSPTTQRLWKRFQHRPKELLMIIVEADPEYAKLAFDDLFNESKDIDMRIDRFIYYSDQLLKLARKNNDDLNESEHHQDARSISLYLSLKYPADYCYYRLDLFRKTTLKLGSLKLPVEDDPARYFKFSKTISKFLMEDPMYEIKEANKFTPSGTLKESLWSVIEFTEWLTGVDITE
jgi:hypothetical protein